MATRRPGGGPPGRVDQPLQFEMENVEYDVGAAVHQNHVTTNDDMSAITGWWRQLPFDFLGARHHLFAQARRQGPSHTQLPFESGRQAVALRQTGRQMVAAIMVVIPIAHGVTIVIAVVTSAIVIVITIMLAVTVPMTLTVRASHSTHRDAGQ